MAFDTLLSYRMVNVKGYAEGHTRLREASEARDTGESSAAEEGS